MRVLGRSVKGVGVLNVLLPNKVISFLDNGLRIFF